MPSTKPTGTARPTGTATRHAYEGRRHAHDDRPETEKAFEHLAGLPEGRERALLCEELVAAWLPMAHRIAHKFRNRGENLDDLRQVAAMGLVKAVNRYEPGRGAFESYAVPTITGELRRHFRDHTWDVRVPRRVQDLRNRVRYARRELTQTPGSPEPTVAQLAEHTELAPQEVRDGLEALDAYRSLSLDAEMTVAGDDGYQLADTLGEADPGYDLVVDRQGAKDGLRRLPEREQTILYLRFFRDMTQSSIAEELGLSQMHVSRLITKSCRQVRAEALGVAS
ncbi:SigB/SigF/SigG family RNA polymerase sigma factor [Streptomyces sp. p1417]|uniref:SigB/SigF/SigG family RNA polymerase sigma factor n=1 Tax=Streptomyces typhae TaxID=2681492 RepID=A0A6L6WXN4_9ACTN|nr:SigB/SigF/SigG family RNA polymerase sigma factor [Streptomyces typhae]MVO86263.1 SigB/SigF/SigG family RNA polymerase sigma factor [Streptomyces typhae]